MVTRTMAVLPARTVHVPKLAPRLKHFRLECVIEVFSHVPSCASRGRPPCTQIPHAALGGAMLCSPRLRVFVPHDFGFQPIRIAEEDAQGSAEIGNGAIRGA